MQSLISRARAWLVPGGVTLLAAALWARWVPDVTTLVPLADGYQYGAYALALVAAWRSQRSRVAAAAVALALAAAVGSGTGGHGLVFQITAFSLPVTLALIALLPDRGVVSPTGLAQQLIVWLQLPLVWALVRLWPDALTAMLAHPILPVHIMAWAPQGQPALAAALAAALLACVVAAARERAVELGLCWSVVGAVLALQVPPSSPVFALFMAASGLVLAFSVVERSHARAFHDETTGLPAGRALWKAADGVRSSYTLAVLDIDHFNQLESRWGHDVSDQVLRMVTTQLRRVTGGRAFRYGGEEFVLLLPGVSRRDALPLLDSLRAAIAAGGITGKSRARFTWKPESWKLPRGSRRSLRVTVSIGAAERGRGDDSPRKVMRAADRALHMAKRAGCNQVK